MIDFLKKKYIMFCVGFCVYIAIEECWRNESYPLMGVCGGLVFILLDMVNDKFGFDTDLLFQCICGSIIATITELVFGTLALNGIIPIMWDYSMVPLNYKGIICLPYSLLWVILSFFAILLADAFNYYWFEDTEQPYYKLFGHEIFRLKAKKCS